jgi:hypothetical protein
MRLTRILAEEVSQADRSLDRIPNVMVYPDPPMISYIG